MAKVEKGKGGKPTDRKGGGKKVVAAPQPVAGESMSESHLCLDSGTRIASRSFHP